MIYFDNAATSGHKPQSVINAVDFALKNLSANPGRSGHKLSLRASDLVYNTRKKLAEFFGANGPEQVVFTQNCTQSLNYVIKGVLKKGDHVVVSNLEHNAVMRPLVKTGVNYDVMTVFDDDNLTINDFESKLKVNTKLVIMTAASNVTGQILPFLEIAKICHKRGVLFCLDGAQLCGVMPINMQKMHIDFLCVAPHKGLYSPMGIGVLICRKPIENTIIEGGTGSSSLEFIQPNEMPEMLESGTLNLPAVAGLSAGIDFVNKVGIQRIYEKEMRLLKMFYTGLSDIPKIVLYTNPPVMHKYAAVIPFNISGVKSDKAATYFDRNGIALRAGLHCAPTAHKTLGTTEFGTMRASFSVFNTEEEVIRAIKVAKKVQKI